MLGLTTLVITILSSLVTAKTVDVQVGQSGLTFSPSSITAGVGDTVLFHLPLTIHSVTQGDFNSPCQPSGNGFYSGFPKTSGTTFAIQLNDTNPVYFFCSSPGHCQAGMTGAINAPSTGNTLDAYAQAAKSTTNSGTPDAPRGGVSGTESSTPKASTTSNGSGASSTPVPTTSANGGAYGTSGATTRFDQSFAGAAGSLMLSIALCYVMSLIA